jgi:hypothetical protein
MTHTRNTRSGQTTTAHVTHPREMTDHKLASPTSPAGPTSPVHAVMPGAAGHLSSGDPSSTTPEADIADAQAAEVEAMSPAWIAARKAYELEHGETIWPLEWLPRDLPKGSRVITVGYDTSLTLWYVVGFCIYFLKER